MKSHIIPGLENCPPFVVVDFNSAYNLYTTPSLAGSTGYDIYLFNWYDGKIGIVNHKTRRFYCLGDFYDLISEEERTVFDENIEYILDTLDGKISSG